MSTKAIAGIIPGVMGISLVAKNVKALNKPMNTKKMMKLGVTNIVGVGLIGATANITNKL